MSNRLLVLGWHNIAPTPGFPNSPQKAARGFEQQLRLLSRFATVLPLRRALDLVEAGEPLPSRAVVLTFDDGYRDNLELGVPLLDRYRLPATFFLVPGFLSGEVGAWWEDLGSAFQRATATSLTWQGTRFALTDAEDRRAAEAAVRGSVKTLDHDARVEAVGGVATLLEPAPSGAPSLFLDWDGARALHEAGHEIGSHTVSHAILGRETTDGQAAELAESRARLETGLGITVDTLAYPNGAAGDYDADTTRLAAELGYRCAVTTRPGLASRGGPPYEMRRVVVTPDDDLRGLVGKVWRKARSLVRR